jgi:AcrR family transcriptional regulator
MEEETDRRGHILAVAARLFAHKGYGSTSVREVVQAAGVTKPTLYYYFDSKEALFREVVSWKLSEGEAVLAAALAEGGTVVELLRRVTKGWLSGAAADPDGLRLMLTCSLPMADEPEVDLMSRHLQSIEPLARLVAEGQRRGDFRDDIEPRVAVMALLGSMNFQLMALIQGQPFDESLVDQLIDLWLHGVSP